MNWPPPDSWCTRSTSSFWRLWQCGWDFTVSWSPLPTPHTFLPVLTPPETGLGWLPSLMLWKWLSPCPGGRLSQWTVASSCQQTWDLWNHLRHSSLQWVWEHVYIPDHSRVASACSSSSVSLPLPSRNDRHTMNLLNIRIALDHCKVSD